MVPSTAPTPTGVRCGNRKYHGDDVVYHASTQAVRECYANSGRFRGDRRGGKTQIVQETQQVNPEMVTVPSPSFADVQARIQEQMHEKERFLAAQRRSRYQAWRSIPVGDKGRANYALRRNGAVVLYQIQRPETGEHAGKTYVKRHSGEGLVRMEWTEAGQVMDAIALDPMAAAVLYGRKAERCAMCHRRLTDDVNKGTDGLTSLERGIGPKCAKKVSR